MNFKLISHTKPEVDDKLVDLRTRRLKNRTPRRRRRDRCRYLQLVVGTTSSNINLLLY